MKKFIYLLLSTLLLFSCGQNDSQSPTQTESPAIASVDSQKANDDSKGLAFTDSIDKANNESIIASKDDITKAYVSSSDSLIYLTANIRKDHRIFGYAEPNTNSKRLLLLSVFTNDVENNPFKCELGAYYDTSGMENLTLKYQGKEGNFIKALATDKTDKVQTVYFEKKWMEFE